MIRYETDPRDIRATDLADGFFEYWPNPPSRETHVALLRESGAIVLAVDEASGRVVGFINAITDGILSAYIPLLEVVPSYRGRGIGTELVRRMIDQLDGLYMIDLLCDPELDGFYARLGMTPSHGMVIRRHEHQAGRSLG